MPAAHQGVAVEDCRRQGRAEVGARAGTDVKLVPRVAPGDEFDAGDGGGQRTIAVDGAAGGEYVPVTGGAFLCSIEDRCDQAGIGSLIGGLLPSPGGRRDRLQRPCGGPPPVQRFQNAHGM